MNTATHIAAETPQTVYYDLSRSVAESRTLVRALQMLARFCPEHRLQTITEDGPHFHLAYQLRPTDGLTLIISANQTGLVNQTLLVSASPSDDAEALDILHADLASVRVFTRNRIVR